MKFYCPHCEKPVELDYLETTGGQMACCPDCKMVVVATYKSDDHRFNWEFKVEKPRPKPETKKKPKGGGCGLAILILIALIILGLMAQCDWRVPYKPPNEPYGAPIR